MAEKPIFYNQTWMVAMVTPSVNFDFGNHKMIDFN